MIQINFYALLVILAIFGSLICWLLNFWHKREYINRNFWISFFTFSLLFVFAVFLTRHTALRGGYDNNHDFGYMSYTISSITSTSVFLFKEGAAVVFNVLKDYLSFFSLTGYLWGQKILWFFSAIMTGLILKKSGLGKTAAFFGAGMFFLNFHTIIAAYSFSTTLINILFFLSAIYVLISFLVDEKRPLFYLIWFSLSSFLVLASRYEFYPVLIVGFLVGLYFKGAQKIKLIWTSSYKNRVAVLFLAIFYCYLCVLWLYKIFTIINYNGPGLSSFFSGSQILQNLYYQLIISNLSLFSFISPLAIFMVLVAFWILLIFFGLKLEKLKSNSCFVFWVVWLFFWVIYFSAIFTEIFCGKFSAYPLQFSRHQLYFFIPFIFFISLLIDALIKAIKKERTSQIVFAIIPFLILIIYSSGNLLIVKKMQQEVRTNDLEWQLLYEASRNWPKDCFVSDSNRTNRTEVIRKYLPFIETQKTSIDDRCILFYRSPYYQVFYDQFDANEKFYITPVRETVFQHRYFTMFIGISSNYKEREKIEPVEVRAGFYKFK